ncbi:dTDP-4-amino-4,6-dideoxygalactose transaminase [Mucilaginibacter pineti]|uniref:dTDP-4-amino-4,6-dideoxygalactose transaminase n=1 Tax=Mucilaginibacter pineti TaxID=1391627 RepID=A0A1G6XDR5_9SPHI|nr:DegT/DnrJ/EryC1/StrS family aminotransferase [Mucilaginibacter pineti]SDD76384.1 dTDP-4-amino-4,6-dideoxygalactose transaminase [Mucilaginibacter pineti]
MKISFAPPYIDQLVIDEVMDTLNSGWITTGPKVAILEHQMKQLTASDAAVCVNSWTSGAILMLKWFGIKEGDEVIIPAYTYCATALSVLHCGATPVMVDVDDDCCISTTAVLKAITPKTKAIIAVDIAGWPCNYKELKAIINTPEIKKLFIAETAKQKALNRILLIADAAHSIGATIDELPASKYSDVSIFSFHAVKNITTAEGGCICINLPPAFDANNEYRYLKLYTLNGQSKDAFTKSNGGGWKYDILFMGLKINMPDICAAIGIGQLKTYHAKLLPLRKRIASIYCEIFKEMDWFIEPALKRDNRESSYHLFALRIKGISEAQRDQIIDSIMSSEITVNVHFTPLPMLTLFKDLGYEIGKYPSAYALYANEISLPIYPQLTDGELIFIIKTVINSVNKVLQLDNFKELEEIEL